MARHEVEDEVRHRVDEPSEERDPREAPFQQYRRRRQQHAESEVQRPRPARGARCRDPEWRPSSSLATGSRRRMSAGRVRPTSRPPAAPTREATGRLAARSSSCNPHSSCLTAGLPEARFVQELLPADAAVRPFGTELRTLAPGPSARFGRQRFRQPGAHIFFAARLDAAQLVYAEAGNDGREVCSG